MLKFLRKYNKWILVFFGVLLMLTFLAPEAVQRWGGSPEERVIATMDGREVRFREMQQAAGELMALTVYTDGFLPQLFRIDSGGRNENHWFLLAEEAQRAGFVGETTDGPEWVNELAPAIAELQLRSQWGAVAQQIMQNRQFFQPMVDNALARLQNPAAAQNAAAQGHLTLDEFNRALSKARGVFRMLRAYGEAYRLSDRDAYARAKQLLDAAWIDSVFIDAATAGKDLPEADAPALQAHFDAYKATRPGQGEYGIGYLLPQRVKLEWLTVEREPVKGAIVLDPIDVNKRWRQNREKYKGDFVTERPAVESDIREDLTDKAIQEAHLAIQAEIAKATRALDPDGRYKKVPPDWDQHRPSMEAIAQAVVDHLKTAAGITIPLPTVTTRSGAWLTQAELDNLPGIGSSMMRQGGLTMSFPELALSVRELAGDRPVPAQVGVPLGESFLTDAAQNRYYITVLGARPESAPDSPDEIRERVVTDERNVRSFLRLKERAEEFRSLAAAQGLRAVVDLVTPPAPPPLLLHEDSPPPAVDQLTINEHARVSAELVTGTASAQLDVEALRKAVVARAAEFDPMAPLDSYDTDRATLAIPLPGRLGLAIVRIVAVTPLTREVYRIADNRLVGQVRAEELQAAQPDESLSPFTYDQLRKRHAFAYVNEGPGAVPQTPEPAPEPPLGG